MILNSQYKDKYDIFGRLQIIPALQKYNEIKEFEYVVVIISLNIALIVSN